MKPIETRYRGYKFRSRTEARHAVFFDATGTKWDYEVEGFMLDNGILYLPDFYLPDLDLYVEVKGTEPSSNEIEAAEALARESGRPVAISIGDALEGGLWVYCCDSCDSGGGEMWHDDSEWCWHDDGHLAINTGDTRSDRVFLSLEWEPINCVIGANQATVSHPILERARDAARSARFEHGEQPDF